MGLLDQVLTDISGGQQGTPSPIGGALSGLLGGGQQAGGGLEGGLPALLSRFDGAGLGNIIQSWIGNGANQPVSPDQLHGVLGDARVTDMAQQTGMAPDDLLSELARHLPTMVDRMTPNGQMPTGGSGINV